MAYYRFIAFLSVFFFTTTLYAQTLGIKDLRISAGGVFSKEDLDWSIAGNIKGENPNIFSELIWSDLKSAGFELAVSGDVYRKIYLDLNLFRSTINSGKSTDSDYEGDDRASRVFYAQLNSNRGSIKSYTAGLGYALVRNRRYKVIPSLGYRDLRQNLFLLNDESDGSDNTLNTTYDTKWRGPYVKLDMQISFSKSFSINYITSYHQVEYEATADWNLIESFQHPISFEHEAKGYQLDLGIRLNKTLYKKISGYASGNYFKSSTGSGIDYLYLKEGNVVATKLNEVNGGGYRIGVGVAYTF
jgi:hypothetical protein